ncbi:MAG: signal peptidase I [Acidobacteriaceae bacterium]
MDENPQPEPPVLAPGAPIPQQPKQSPGPAFASAVFPGLGQLALGEKRKVLVYFALLAIWIFLFFPPIQSPRNWSRWGNQEVAGIILAIVSTWQALRFRAGGKRPAHFALLIALVPLAGISMVLGHKLLTRAAGYRDYRVNGKAMQPALRDEDQVMVNLREFRSRVPAHGEVVILQSPIGTVIKRVIAEGGDTIAGKDGQISLNGQVLDEPYVMQTSRSADRLVTFGPVTIPPHKYFVMGDNRNLSWDSRLQSFGLIDETAILGKALYITGTGHKISGQ